MESMEPPIFITLLNSSKLTSVKDEEQMITKSRVLHYFLSLFLSCKVAIVSTQFLSVVFVIIKTRK